jgi:hypothetical protein
MQATTGFAGAGIANVSCLMSTRWLSGKAAISNGSVATGEGALASAFGSISQTPLDVNLQVRWGGS